MSLVETYQRQKLERRLRFARAAMRHLEREPKPAPVSHEIPNTPFGIPKIPPRPPIRAAVVRRGVFYILTAADEDAWMIEICGESVQRDRIEPRIEQIQRAVCEHFGISRTDMLSSRRTRDLVRPRMVAVYLSRLLTKRSLPEIGRRFGGRDHSTQIHSIKVIERQLPLDEQLRASVEMLTYNLGGVLA